MSTAEVAPEASLEEKGSRPTHPSIPPVSPMLPAGWLLRAAAWSAVAAGAMGVIVAPGIRGHASEQAVVTADWTAAVFSYFLVGLLLALLVWAVKEMLHSRVVGLFARVALIGGAAVVVALSSPALHERLPPLYAVLVSAAAVVATIGGGYASARAPHTRALSGVLFALAFAAIARLGAWELATAAGDRASVQLFTISRGLATAGVLFEGCGHLIAVTWLWSRGRSAGQLACVVAAGAAFLVTFGVAHGVHSGASPWQAVLYTALADAPGVPPPYNLDALATFLVPSSLCLGLVAAAQPKQVVAVVAAMALALVSRGAFDAPLRALCAVAAAHWAALACADERSMWRTLIDDRKRRLAEDGLDDEAAPPPRTP
ncbi:MAG TPA: hypothetical protein VE987_03685 [Polyangiaceae bacterium]|nr:hypothetical protein [Polyangiaceae bacterium]